MQKAEPQHGQTQHPPAPKQGGGLALASSQGEHIAQLDAAMDSSPQAGKLGALSAMMNASPAMSAQRKTMDNIHNSPRQAAQQNKFDNLFGTAQRVEDDESLQGKIAYPSPGQEQAQARAQPAMQMEGGVPVNGGKGLEADAMGGRAVTGRQTAVQKAGEGGKGALGNLHIPMGSGLQLRRNKKKKKRTRGESVQNNVLGINGAGTFPIARENQTGNLGEEVFESPRLFWRGDNRTPDQVVKTGFTSKNERDGLVMEKANVIKWRVGNNQDDIDPDSGVCVAADIRGSAFFPLDQDAKFIYAVALTQAVNTYAIQKMVEEHDTGTGEEVEERYPYDPDETLSDEQSAIWQFKEYVAHRIEKNEIVACYEIERENYLLGAHQKTIAGIRFRLTNFWERPSMPNSLNPVLDKANTVTKEYENWYPDLPNQYLSYYGIIEDLTGNRPQDSAEAQQKYENNEIRHVSPLVGESPEDAYDRKSEVNTRKKQRSKNRHQKKRKKFRGKH